VYGTKKFQCNGHRTRKSNEFIVPTIITFTPTTVKTKCRVIHYNKHHVSETKTFHFDSLQTIKKSYCHWNGSKNISICIHYYPDNVKVVHHEHSEQLSIILHILERRNPLYMHPEHSKIYFHCLTR